MVGALCSNDHGDKKDKGQYQIEGNVYRALLQPAWAAFGTPFGICSSVDELELDADANKSSDVVVEYDEEVADDGDANKDDCGQ